MHVIVVGAGLHYGLPGTWNGMHKRGMKPEDVTRLCSTHAAKLAGMQEVGRLHMHVIVVGAGLQYGLPGTWNGMRERGMKLEDVTRLWSTHAAKLAGMQEAGRLHMHVIVVGAGLQYGLPGTWNGMRERGMKLEDVTRLWSTHAAKLTGMQEAGRLHMHVIVVGAGLQYGLPGHGTACASGACSPET